MKPIKWGLFIDDMLMAEYSSFEDALQSLNFVHQETGVPHELKMVEGKQ